MPPGIVMVSVSKSSTFIVSRNGQKLPELMKDGDVQVNSNAYYTFAIINLTKGTIHILLSNWTGWMDSKNGQKSPEPMMEAGDVQV